MKEPNHKYIAGLVIRAQHEDSDAFAELYGLTYSKVLHYAERYLRDSYLAQDAVQEIFILALKNISKLKEPTLFIAWMNQISFRVCYDAAALFLELLQIIHNERTKECATVFKCRFVNYNSSALRLDSLHNALNRGLTEVV